MNNEIKEMLEQMRSIATTGKDKNDIKVDGYGLQQKELKIFLNYITNLQEQLHQASLDIQELTEKDIECPSWCDKLTNLQQENDSLRTRIKTIKRLRKKQTQKKNKYKSIIFDEEQKLKDYKQENERLKARVAYLERSNNRREDTILGLRQEIYEQEDYKSRCEKAIKYIDTNFCIENRRDLKEVVNILQNGSDEE